MSDLQVTMVGAREAQSLIDELGKRAAQGAAEAAYLEAQYEVKLIRPHVPVGDTGNLRASGRAERLQDEGSGLAVAAVAYGGPAWSTPGQWDNVDYAVIVHEDLAAHHPHGKAKFAEDVIRDEMNSGRALERMRTVVLRRLPTFVSGRFTSRSGLLYLREPTTGRFAGSERGVQG